MKKFRKIMAILVAALMIAATMVPAWAGDYQITIFNAIKGEQYTAYKIFDLTDGGQAADQNKTYRRTADTNAIKDKIYYEQKTKSSPTGTITYYEKVNPAPAQGTSLSSKEYYELRPYVAYTIKKNSAWYPAVSAYKNQTDSGLKLTEPAGDATVDVVTFEEDKFDAAAFAAYLKGELDKFNDEDASTVSVLTTAPAIADTKPASVTLMEGNGSTAASSTVVLDVSGAAGGAAGYYFVDTTLGSIVALDSASKTINMFEKNTTPTLQKLISDGTLVEGKKVYGENDIDVNIGDTVYYQLVVTDGDGTDTAITVHDSLEAGLTLNPSFTVNKKVGETLTPASAGTDYVVTIKTGTLTKTAHTYGATTAHTYKTAANTDCTFEIKFSDAYVAGLNKGEQIVIEYDATLNWTSGEIYYPTTPQDTNYNIAYLTYANQKTPDQTRKAKTYEFQILKYDDKTSTNSTKNGIDGVDFQLTRDADSAIYQDGLDTTLENATTTRKVWEGSSTSVKTTADGGKIIFKGLDAGLYTLTEKKAAAGYNLMTSSIKIEVKSDGTVELKNSVPNVDVTAAETSGETIITIPNTPGTALPSTGGMGTTVLYIVGGMLIVLAGAYLFFSRKKTA